MIYDAKRWGRRAFVHGDRASYVAKRDRDDSVNGSRHGEEPRVEGIVIIQGERALGSRKNSSALLLIDSEKAGQIRLMVGMVGACARISSQRNFLDPLTLTGVRSVVHRCLF